MKRSLLLGLVLLLAGCQWFSDPRPNIIFIMADDLGYGHLGSYGQEKIRTPHLDQMAKEGMRFSQFYSGHCVCAPSRSVLMTGQHTGHTSVRINGGGSALLPEDVTVAEVLRSAGYITGLFGKWGLGEVGTTGEPTNQGFHEYFGYLHQVHAHFYYPYFLWKNGKKHILTENEGQKRNEYSHDLIAQKALEFIRRNQDQRFFLYLPLTIPHFELLVPEDSLLEYEGEFPEPWAYEGDHYASQPAPRTTLAAMITRMDRDIGRIFALLEELGLDEETIVLFTSDNGGYNLGDEIFHGNGPLRGGKGRFYEGGIRVPLVVRWPGRISEGTTSDFISAFWDVMPTLAELAKTSPPEGIDGVSMLPVLLGEEMEQSDRHLYWEQIPGLLGGNVQPWRVAVRRGNWKALRLKPDLPLELYDLEIDLGEQTNVAEQFPEIVQELEDYLRKARSMPRQYPPQEPSWEYPPLETGYVK